MISPGSRETPEHGHEDASATDGWSATNTFSIPTPSEPALAAPGNLSSPGPIVHSPDVLFVWFPVDTAARYGVYFRDLLTDVLVLNTNILRPNTSYRATLTRGHTYRWNMQAFNGNSESPIRLTWRDNSIDETGFEIERVSVATGTTTHYSTLANQTEYQDTDVAAGTTYRYRVRSVKETVTSAYTSPVEITPQRHTRFDL